MLAAMRLEKESSGRPQAARRKPAIVLTTLEQGSFVWANEQAAEHTRGPYHTHSLAPGHNSRRVLFPPAHHVKTKRTSVRYGRMHAQPLVTHDATPLSTDESNKMTKMTLKIKQKRHTTIVFDKITHALHEHSLQPLPSAVTRWAKLPWPHEHLGDQCTREKPCG